MNDGERVSVERRPPEETFALLGNETRLAILQALGETPQEAVTFSELRARIHEGDSGKFITTSRGCSTTSFARPTRATSSRWRASRSWAP